MIKNNNQLTHAVDRLAHIDQDIEQYRQRFSGIELELYVIPLVQMRAEVTQEIYEYMQLRDMPFEQAVTGPLSKPMLIDNMGEFLAKLRIAAKLNQMEMADRLGWAQPNLARFESENYSSHTINKVVDYANALGIWLYVTPSLTEKLPDIEFMKETDRWIVFDQDSTTSDPLDKDELETDSAFSSGTFANISHIMALDTV